MPAGRACPAAHEPPDCPWVNAIREPWRVPRLAATGLGRRLQGRAGEAAVITDSLLVHRDARTRSRTGGRRWNMPGGEHRSPPGIPTRVTDRQVPARITCSTCRKASAGSAGATAHRAATWPSGRATTAPPSCSSYRVRHEPGSSSSATWESTRFGGHPDGQLGQGRPRRAGRARLQRAAAADRRGTGRADPAAPGERRAQTGATRCPRKRVNSRSLPLPDSCPGAGDQHLSSISVPHPLHRRRVTEVGIRSDEPQRSRPVRAPRNARTAGRSACLQAAAVLIGSVRRSGADPCSGPGRQDVVLTRVSGATSAHSRVHRATELSGHTDQAMSASLVRRWSTALVCSWQMRLSVTPSTRPISARVRPSK